MDIKIRNYSDQDYTEFIDMVYSLYYEDDIGQPMNTSKIEATINEYKKNPEKVKVVLITNSQNIMGYSILAYFWSNEYGGNVLLIDELYIKETFRSNGIGSYFIKFIEESEEVVALKLEATPSNTRGFNLYMRLGFQVAKNTHLIKSIEKNKKS